jgi:hypothetical protein
MKKWIIELPDTFKPPTTGGTCPKCCQFIDAPEDVCDPDNCPFKGQEVVEVDSDAQLVWDKSNKYLTDYKLWATKEEAK